MRNTLHNEGIKPANTEYVVGSSHGKASSSNYRLSAYAEMNKKTPQRKISSTRKTESSIVDMGPSNPYFLPRCNWISLAEGWYQCTPIGTGSTSRFGLHNVLESSLGQFFMCLYEPRSTEAVAACTSSCPEYDLEVSAKLQTKSVSGSSPAKSIFAYHNFIIVFAFKSATDYCSLKCDGLSKTWSILRSVGGEDFILAESEDANIKLNSFFLLLIQIRGNSVSIDVDGSPMFTHIRPTDTDNLSGLIGVNAKGSKFAMKGWRLRPVEAISRSSNPPVNPMRYKKQSLADETDTREMILDSDGDAHRGASSPYRNRSGEINNESGRQGTGSKPMSLLDSLNHKAASQAQTLPMRRDGGTSTAHGGSSSSRRINGRDRDKDSQSNHYYLQMESGQFGHGQGIYGVDGADNDQYNSRSSSYSDENSNGSYNYYDDQYALGECSTHSNGIGDGASYSNHNRNYNHSHSHSHSHSQNRSQNHNTGSKIEGQLPNPNFDGKGQCTPPPQTQNTRRLQDEQMLAECTSLLLASHDKGVVETVMRDINQRDLGVTFDDIASLSTAKRLLNEAVVLPLIMPEFFTGIREPWKGVLLFGPPGTGKTLLAKAVCSFNSSTFFSCSSSSLISKYRGESEKIVRCLFEAARLCSPSIIFIDEVDAMVSTRGADSEHEASRRLKTEFFSQMDGLASARGVEDTALRRVMVLATTNCPWDLDDALRRRLEKRIYIPLPDEQSRRELFGISLRDIPISDQVASEIDELAAITGGFSGSDVRIACKDASMMPMRRLLSMMSPKDIMEMRKSGQLTIPKVIMDDFRNAISNTKPSVAIETIARYEEWEAEFSNT